jgi:hypothetical protein
MKAPTYTEFLEEQHEVVQRTIDDNWRHGITVIEVYERKDDNTFWQVVYRKDASGDYNGLREGTAAIFEVRPETYTATRYVPAHKDEGCEGGLF